MKLNAKSLGLVLFVGVLLAGVILVSGCGEALVKTGALTITSSGVVGDNIVVKGETTIDPSKSTYIQYYIGKEYPDTICTCIYCDGLNADMDGHFKLELPKANFRGSGTYRILLEQNPKSNAILGPEHFKAFWKDEGGVVHFGDVSAMGQLTNLAAAVGMEIVETKVTIR